MMLNNLLKVIILLQIKFKFVSNLRIIITIKNLEIYIKVMKQQYDININQAPILPFLKK